MEQDRGPQGGGLVITRELYLQTGKKNPTEAAGGRGRENERNKKTIDQKNKGAYKISLPGHIGRVSKRGLQSAGGGIRFAPGGRETKKKVEIGPERALRARSVYRGGNQNRGKYSLKKKLP